MANPAKAASYRSQRYFLAAAFAIFGFVALIVGDDTAAIAFFATGAANLGLALRGPRN
ncbi:MAG TPA: hypothetical protein VN817_05005 [Solirubrobacteraceae bacterium]|nr:hypothetical protein [Solirubrobacteraceae bacterium]